MDTVRIPDKLPQRLRPAYLKYAHTMESANRYVALIDLRQRSAELARFVEGLEASSITFSSFSIEDQTTFVNTAVTQPDFGIGPMSLLCGVSHYMGNPQKYRALWYINPDYFAMMLPRLPFHEFDAATAAKIHFGFRLHDNPHTVPRLMYVNSDMYYNSVGKIIFEMAEVMGYDKAAGVLAFLVQPKTTSVTGAAFVYNILESTGTKGTKFERMIKEKLDLRRFRPDQSP